MAYLQVDLANASSPVRDAFREFTHVETDIGSDVIIIAASEQELADKLKATQMLAASLDETYVYPTQMQEISPAIIINGKAIREHFHEALTADLPTGD